MNKKQRWGMLGALCLLLLVVGCSGPAVIAPSPCPVSAREAAPPPGEYRDQHKDAHAHHVFPQSFAKQFRQRGINIHDPRYGTWWRASEHLRSARAYNHRWFKFLRSAPSKDFSVRARSRERLWLSNLLLNRFPAFRQSTT